MLSAIKRAIIVKGKHMILWKHLNVFLLTCLLTAATDVSTAGTYSVSIKTEKTSAVFDLGVDFSCTLESSLPETNKLVFTVKAPVVDIRQKLKSKKVPDQNELDLDSHIHGEGDDKILEGIAGKQIVYQWKETTWHLVSDGTRKNQLLGPLSSLTSCCLLDQLPTSKRRRIFGRSLKTISSVKLDGQENKTLVLSIFAPQNGDAVRNYELRVSDDEKKTVLLSRLVLADEAGNRNQPVETLEVLVAVKSWQAPRQWFGISGSGQAKSLDGSLMPEGKRLLIPRWNSE